MSGRCREWRTAHQVLQTVALIQESAAVFPRIRLPGSRGWKVVERAGAPRRIPSGVVVRPVHFGLLPESFADEFARALLMPEDGCADSRPTA